MELCGGKGKEWDEAYLVVIEYRDFSLCPKALCSRMLKKSLMSDYNSESM